MKQWRSQQRKKGTVPEEAGKAKVPMPRLTAARALAVVVRDEEEEKLIRQVHRKQNNGRERQRLMHNGMAEEKGHHRIEMYKTMANIGAKSMGNAEM